MFKELTGPDGATVAVNPLHVMRISTYHLGKAYPKHTKLDFTNGAYQIVVEDYDYVVDLLTI
jgi:hypothetical protein